LGAAIFGAVAGGVYKKTEDAQAAMCGLKTTVYKPNPKGQKVYEKLFKLYKELHDIFGTNKVSYNLGHVMKELLEIKSAAV